MAQLRRPSAATLECLLALLLFGMASCDSARGPVQPALTPEPPTEPAFDVATSRRIALDRAAVADETNRPPPSESDSSDVSEPRQTLRLAELPAAEEPTFGPLTTAEDARLRSWMSRNGESNLEAELVDYVRGIARLKTRSGQERAIKLKHLSAADRAFIAAWHRAKAHESPNLDYAEPNDRSTISTSLRNQSFPDTYIESIHVDLSNARHWVRLVWTGPDANRQETGPFRSSPGRGLGHNNCDDENESNRNGSNCTPKGVHVVEGFSDLLPSYPRCRFVTWFDIRRQIAFHSHWSVPSYPASHGCVRLDPHAAQLIHNNAKIGETRVLVDGTWSR